MSSFLNQLQIDNITGVFQKHFNQFSTGINNFVTIFKEPLSVVSNTAGVNIYGYGPDNNGNITDVTYQEIKGVVPCVIINSKNINSLPFLQLQTSIDENSLFIKVDESGRNFITQGKNEKCVINGQDFNIIPRYSVQNYFGLKFYYFKCDLTQ